MTTRICNRCKEEKPATTEFFGKDSSRPLGIAYECRPCHSERKKGRDRRKERWSNMTEEQREKASARNKRYSKTLKGRACFLKSRYSQVDSCNLTTEEVMEIIKQPCSYCGTVTENRGLDRIDNSKGHDKGNVVAACRDCNVMRADNFTHEEMFVIGEAIRKVKAARTTS